MPLNHQLIRVQIVESDRPAPFDGPTLGELSAWSPRWHVTLTYVSGSSFEEHTRTYSELTFEEAYRINKAWQEALLEIEQNASAQR